MGAPRSTSVRVLAACLCAVGATGIVLFLWAPRPVTVEQNVALHSATDAETRGAAAETVRGSGTILGEVVLVGVPPSMQPLKLGADPICAAASSRDEQVIATNGKLENVFIRLTDGPAQPPPSVPVVIDQVSCVFRPRIQGAIRGQTLQIRNGDRTLHNVHGYAGPSTLFNYAQPATAPPVERGFPEGARVIKLKCDVHPWMTAYVLITDNGYFAVSGRDGSFSIRGIPAGSYHLEAWHERFGVKTAKVTLGEGETARVAFSYSAGDRG
jgi:hypothetical protein